MILLWVLHGFSILDYGYAGDDGNGDDQQGQRGQGEEHCKTIWTPNKKYLLMLRLKSQHRYWTQLSAVLIGLGV